VKYIIAQVVPLQWKGIRTNHNLKYLQDLIVVYFKE